MRNPLRAALIAASATFALSGCMTDDYGYGGGVSMGYGSGYYGGGYGDPYYGWYDNYYYPGTGYYVYDRGGRRRAWNDGQRRYWEGRRGDRQGSDNWSGWRGNRRPEGVQNWGQNDGARRDSWRARQGSMSDADRQARREAWQAQRQQQGSASSDRWQARREAWQAQRQQQGQSMGTGESNRGGWGGRQGGGRRGRD